jgi:hypothetical protein
MSTLSFDSAERTRANTGSAAGSVLADCDPSAAGTEIPTTTTITSLAIAFRAAFPIGLPPRRGKTGNAGTNYKRVEMRVELRHS